MTIDSAPAAKTDTRSATLTFSSTDGDAGFQCKVNTGLFDACESPLELGSLEEGAQTVTVRAVDPAGNVSGTPAEATWIIEDPTCDPGFSGTPPNCVAIPLPDGKKITATLTEGVLGLASLGEAPLPAEQLILNGEVDESTDKFGAARHRCRLQADRTGRRSPRHRQRDREDLDPADRTRSRRPEPRTVDRRRSSCPSGPSSKRRSARSR